LLIPPDQVHNQEELQRLLENIDMPLRRVNDDLKNITDNLESKKIVSNFWDLLTLLDSRRVKILQWLSLQPFNEHHTQVKENVLKGTGQWLLSHPVFTKWKKDSASSILWLHGIQGSGKSSLV